MSLITLDEVEAYLWGQAGYIEKPITRSFLRRWLQNRFAELRAREGARNQPDEEKELHPTD